MGIVDRIVLGLYSLSLSVISLAFFLVALGWTSPLALIISSFRNPQGRLAVGTLSLVFFVVSVRFLYYGFRKAHQGQAVVHESPLGEVRISLGAVENLVSRVARQIQGVRDVRSSVTNTPGGILVTVRSWVSPDVSIPSVSSEMQKSIKNYVANVVGTGVSEIRVLVENITTDSRKSRVE